MERFAMEEDDCFINFIAERVYRGTCLVFTLGPIPPVTGWVTGIDDYFIQVANIPDMHITLISRDQIATVEEYRTNQKILKIDSLPQAQQDMLLKVTKRIRDKAQEFKEQRT